MAKKLKVMISSSVNYGAASLLRQTYTTMLADYDVICSSVGSMPVNPKVSNQVNCLESVKECDIFIGFIRPLYGSGKDTKDGKSITHLELERAIDLDKPRWILAHSSVVKMRRLIRRVFFNKDGSRNGNEFTPLTGEFDDLRVIEMYEKATDSNNKKVAWSQKKNNWVQEYHYDFEALDYISKQFKDPKEIAAHLNSKEGN